MSKDLHKKNENVDEFIISDLGVNKDVTSKSKKDFLIKKFNIKIFAIAILIFLVIATIVFVIKFMSFNATSLIWKTNLTRGSESVNNKSIEYASFRNGLMRISNDGITFVDSGGSAEWTVSYNIKDPIYVSKNKYFAIADKNGNNFYIFDVSGMVGSGTTTSPIVKITISREGVLYVMQSDDNNNYISVFRSTGVPIDLSIKTNLTEDGMPIDLSTSDSGEELAVCYVCLNEEKIYTKASYYNFGDAGKNANSKRVVGEFVDEFDNRFLARAHFFNDTKSCLVSDDGIFFVSTSDEARPKIINKTSNDENILSISYNEKFFATIYENNHLMVYDDNGSIICDRKIDIDYTKFYLSGDYIIFIDGSRVLIYDIRGRLIFDNELEGRVEYVAKRNSLFFTELLVGLIDGVECIRFY